MEGILVILINTKTWEIRIYRRYRWVQVDWRIHRGWRLSEQSKKHDVFMSKKLSQNWKVQIWSDKSDDVHISFHKRLLPLIGLAEVIRWNVSGMWVDLNFAIVVKLSSYQFILQELKHSRCIRDALGGGTLGTPIVQWFGGNELQEWERLCDNNPELLAHPWTPPMHEPAPSPFIITKSASPNLCKCFTKLFSSHHGESFPNCTSEGEGDVLPLSVCKREQWMSQCWEL